MKPHRKITATLRKIRAGIRDTWLLLRQFGLPLLAFLISIIGGGLLYYSLSRYANKPVQNPLESIYTVLLLTFLQTNDDFPKEWYLEVFFFIMPLIGLVIISQGVTEFALMLFNRRARGKEWETAVASTFNKHHIVIGLGHLGYRVVRNLHEMNQDVVVIEANPSADLVANIKRMGIPVIEDDASREAALIAAGVHKARSVVLCTQNDSLNLQVALKARRMNKNVRVVVRIFDDDFAQSLHDQFGFIAFSATNMAAPAFAASAAGVEMTNPITIEGETMSLARLEIGESSPLASFCVGDLEKRFNVSVVLLRRNRETDLHPAAEMHLQAGDSIAVLGGPTEISYLVRENTS